MTKPIQRQSGFTLLEIIITIVVAALAGVMVFTFLSHTVVRSGEPLQSIRSLAEIKPELEGLTADYNRYLRREIEWSEFKNILDATDGTLDDVSGEFDGTFEVLQLTVSGDYNQKLTVFFTE